VGRAAVGSPDEQDGSVSTRIITSPDDIRDGWYVIDDDVVRLENAEFARPKRGATEPDASSTTIVAGSHRFSIGDEIEPAAGRALDEGFIRSVRGLWSFLLGAAAGGVGLAILEAIAFPWPEGPGTQFVVRAAVILPLLLVAELGWRRLTRRPDGRVTRAMAGRLREDYDRQRGETTVHAVSR
jgi:hypothetical protein